MNAGAELRNRGIHQLELAELWDPWPDVASTALRQLAESGHPFTADGVRALVGDPPRSAAMGAVFRRAAVAGLIERVAYREADRAERRGGVVAVWRGVVDP